MGNIMRERERESRVTSWILKCILDYITIFNIYKDTRLNKRMNKPKE